MLSARLSIVLAALLAPTLALAQKDLRWTEPPPMAGEGIDPTAALAPAWTAWGGHARIDFNEDVLSSYGAKVRPIGAARHADGLIRLPVHEQGGLHFKVGGTQFQGFTEGSLQLRGGVRLTAGGRTLTLDHLRMVPRKSDRWELELVDAKGTVWFVNDHVHYQLSPDRTEIEMFNMDLRATPAMAEWLGDPLIEGHRLGAMALSAEVRVDGSVSAAMKSCSVPNWPNTPGAPDGGLWLADVLLTNSSSIDFMRCQNCSGPSGATDGQAVFAPNATLRNSNTDNTAEVPWYAKFSGYRPPYNNDQHPFLIWNLYRIDAEGRLEQIARSGVKHAFLTTNTACNDPTCGSVSGSILGRHCQDIYSSGNNDSNTALGPRSEIVPALGIWGRCGSIYDPDCNHVANNANVGSFDHRMIVRESQIRASANPGASYFMESWYIVRDDINIYNTMGGRDVTPTFGSNWQLANVSGKPFVQGPYLNRWVDPANPGPNAANVELVTNEGRARVAVRATQLQNGNWRYDYAVMNYDYARADMQRVAVTGQPQAEVYRVNRNFGFSAFEVPHPGAGAVTNFSDGDTDAGNNWSATFESGRIRFAGMQSNALNWGTLYSFRIESPFAPTQGSVTLRPLDAGDPASFTVDILVPGVEMFANGFE